MPIYEYHCSKCGNFEAMQKISDKPLAHCPTCRRRVTKLISTTSFQLKGSGWYVTDYARKGGGKAESKGEGKKDTEKGPGSAEKSVESASSSTEKSGESGSGGDKPSGEKKKSSEKTAAA